MCAQLQRREKLVTEENALTLRIAQEESALAQDRAELAALRAMPRVEPVSPYAPVDTSVSAAGVSLPADPHHARLQSQVSLMISHLTWQYSACCMCK